MRRDAEENRTFCTLYVPTRVLWRRLLAVQQWGGGESTSVATKAEADNQQFGHFIADSKSLVRISTSLNLEMPDAG